MERMKQDPKTGRFMKHETPNLCQIKKCSNKAYGHGLCSIHYQRLIRHGDPTVRLKAANGEGGLAHGYRKITVNGKRTYEHRHVMQQHLGRELHSSEIVHHKDGDKLNNSLNNLELTTRKKHISEHPEVVDNLKLGPSARWGTRT